MGILTLWKNKRQQGLKERVLKNREGILDAMAENIKGARSCPFIMGQKCLGIMCEFFAEYETFPDKNGNSKTYHRCNINQTPILILELLNETRKGNQLLEILTGIFTQTAEKEKQEPPK